MCFSLSINFSIQELFTLIRLDLLTESAVHIVQSALAYGIMLSIATWNAWILLSALVGYAVGYYAFSNDLSVKI
jgi:hypothetical protein